MSDEPDTVGSSFSSQVVFMLGRLESKIDGLVASMARMENEHANLVAKNAQEHSVLRDGTLAGDAQLAMRIEAVKADLGKRIEGVEIAAERVTTSYRTVRVMAMASAAVIAGVFAVVQWVLPLLHFGAAVMGH